MAKAAQSTGKPRGRPKKAATNGAEAQPRTPKVMKATKANGPSADDIQEWLTEMTEIDTQMARVRQKSSTLKKTVENGSGDWKALKAAFASTKMSKAEATEKLEQTVRYHQAINIRISWSDDGQAEMTDVMETSAPVSNENAAEKLAAARAHGDGYNSGSNGAAPHDNPFNPGTEEYVMWLKGRDDGALDRDLKTATNMSTAQSSSSPMFSDN